jgi:hypothetical protein
VDAEQQTTHAHAQSRDTDSSVHGNSAPVQRVDHHDHGSKTLAIIALVVAGVVSGLALGCVIVFVILAPQLIDAKVEAGRAQSEATAREARTTAKMTEDKLVELRDHLNSKGMNIPKLDGH